MIERIRARWDFIVWGILSLLVALAYANSLPNDFVLDDNFVIEKNPLIRSLDQVPLLLTTDYWAGRRQVDETAPEDENLYRPFVMVTYALNYAVSGLNPWGYRLINLLLHLGVCWLIYRIALESGWKPASALIAAALFAAHPLHTEAVSSIIGRAELLMAGGVLASVLAASQRRHGWALVAFVVALGSKEQAVILPLLLIWDHVCHGMPTKEKTRPSKLRLYMPYLIILAAFLGIRWMVLGNPTVPSPPFIDNPLAHVWTEYRLLTAMAVVGDYLWLFVWPASLSADYSYKAIPIITSVWSVDVWMTCLIMGGIGGLAIWAWRRHDRRVAWATGILVLAFLPTSNLMIPIGTTMGERLFYLPSAGLCLLVGWLWERYGEAISFKVSWNQSGLAVSAIVLVAVIGALTVRTAARNLDWATSMTLFQSAARVVPNSAKVHAILGGLLFEQGKPEEAVHEMERSVELYGNWFLSQYNLGVAYVKIGKPIQAELAFRKALILDGTRASVHISLCRLLVNEARYTEALAATSRALENGIRHPAIHYYRGRSLEALGHKGEARKEYQLVLTAEPPQEIKRDITRRLRSDISTDGGSSRPENTSHRQSNRAPACRPIPGLAVNPCDQ